MAKSNFSEALMDVAIAFWVKALCPDDEGATTPEDDMAMLRLPPKVGDIISRAKSRLVPKEAQLKVFAERLKELLIEPIGGPLTPERAHGVISPRWIELRTDYEAQGLLYLAAKHAGISSMAFPFKTIVLIKHGRITTGFPETLLFEGPAPVGSFGQID